MPASHLRPLSFFIFAVLVSACAHTGRDANSVLDEVADRGGAATLPGTPDLADGLDEQEVIAWTLANSPAIAEELVRLRDAQLVLDDAARLQNPRLSLLAPIGEISAAASLVAPLIHFFQMPQRTREAALRLESVAASLVDRGLAVVTDARLAYIDRVYAGERLTLLEEQRETTRAIRDLVYVRVELGDASPSQRSTVDADLAIADNAVQMAATEVVIADARLCAAIGVVDPVDVALDGVGPLPTTAPPLHDLLEVARSTRPDVLAAEYEIEAAGERIGIARSSLLDIAAQVDVQWSASATGVRVGGQGTIPVFDRHQLQRGQAETQLDAALAHLDVVRQQVVLDVRTAHARLTEALSARETFLTTVLAARQAALDAAVAQQNAGATSSVEVLLAAEALAGAQLQALAYEADAHRALAQLERAVGAQLTFTAPQGAAP